MFLYVVAVGVAVPLVVRLPLPRQAALLSRTARGGGSHRRRSHLEPERTARCVDIAQRVAAPLVRRGCLIRAISLYWFLGPHDADIELCFGVGRVDGQFSGHCWLTRSGEPYLERTDPREWFDVVYRIPSDRTRVNER